jgi:aldehyde:ferredoxin oxidoreductase
MGCFSYAGKQLYVNLTDSRIWEEPMDCQEVGKYLGGMGLQLRLLYRLLKPGIDPLSPGNPVVIGSGTLTCTGAPGSSRIMATTKYPETGSIGCGGGGMRFGFMLKLAGYDHIVIVGKARKPVYLKIASSHVEICDASYLWGKDIVETTESLWREHGDCGVIAIGQAGEHLVKISQTVCDLGSSLGRGGLGAVMGSKNLKALVSKGTGSIRVADTARFNEARKSLFERAKRYPYHNDSVRYSIMPNWVNYRAQIVGYTKNRTFVPNIEELDTNFGFEAYKKFGKRAFGCPSCFIVDKEIVEVPSGPFKGLKWSTGTYLNAAVLGARLGLKDAGEAVKAADMTDRYGLDQSSFADIMDFLFALHEEGAITVEDVGGLPLNRGSIDVVLTWLERTVLREGFGRAVADGWQGLIDIFGDGIIKQTEIIKGRQGVWEPRISGLGTNEFAQLTYPRGPNSESGGSGLYSLNQPVDTVKRHAQRMGLLNEAVDRVFSSPFKVNIGRLTVNSEHWLAIFNSLGICNRHVNNRFYNIDVISELYQAATGAEADPQDLMKCAERVWNVLKMINVREGFSRTNDQPPEKWFEPIKTFDGKELFMMDYYRTKVLNREDVARWLDDYYDERGWDIEKGIPTPQKLTELEMGEMLNDLEQAKKGLST